MALKKQAQGIRRFGSAALDLAFTAAGSFDGYWEMRLSPWDIAAGILIVQEAGGKVTDWRGDAVSLTRCEVLASNGQIHGALSGVLASTPARPVRLARPRGQRARCGPNLLAPPRS